MKYTNQNLSKPWVFQDRTETFRIRNGPSTYRWKRIVARVSCILVRRRDVFVIVDAMDQNPREASKEDILNAQLATWVVSRQTMLRYRYKSYRAVLKYPNAIQVEVEYDPEKTGEIIKKYLFQSRSNATADALPTQLLTYLLVSQSIS